MFNQLLIEEVFNQPWCIEKQYAQGLVVAALSAIKNQNFNLQSVSSIANPYAVTHEDKTVSTDFQPGSVGIITLDGPVVENSDLRNGIKGTEDICNEFMAMENDPNIIGTVFNLNTGGGAAYAMKPLEDLFASRTKPMGIFSKRIIASAGYGIGVHGDFIMMYHPMGVVGSIGTMISMNNIIPMLEKWGIEFHEIYATLSTMKNKQFNDALKGNYDPLRQKMLDPFNNSLIKSVTNLRGNKLDPKEKGIFQGETYMAKKAIKLGLIDQIGTLSDAVNEVRNLDKGKATFKNTPAQSIKKEDINMKFPKLVSLAGKNEATQEELAAVNAELAEAGVTAFAVFPESVVTDADTVTANLKTATDKVTNLEKELGEAKSSLTTSQAEVTNLQGKLANAPAAVAPKVEPKEVKTELTEAEINQQAIDELPHNKAIANNPLFN